MSVIFGKLLVAAVLLASPSIAKAEWRRAESPHFVVFGEVDRSTITEAAVRLEKLDALQRFIAGIPDAATPSILKVKVYLLPDDVAVRATMPWPGSGVAGYYNAGIRGPIAVNPRTDEKATSFPAQFVLFHELTHHFMFQYFNAAYPIWYREGLADFIGTATFDGDIAHVGAPAMNRYYAFGAERKYAWISMGRLLTAPGGGTLGNRSDLIYSQGWLLTHYLTLGGTRPGQLRKYLDSVNAGKSYAEAATSAFGDLTVLDRELHAYANRPSLTAKLVPLKGIRDIRVAVEEVSPALSAMMVFDIRMSAGIPTMQAGRFANAVRKIAQRFPDDPDALRLRVEADRLADDRDDRAEALAIWAKVAPEDSLMLLHRALLQQDRLVAAGSTDTMAWDAVRETIVAAGKAGRGSPRILAAYYDSYVAQRIDPTPGAQNTLHNALGLMPQNDELRYMLALDYDKRGMIRDAINTIRPAAFSDDEDPVKSERAKARTDKTRQLYRIAGTPFHETPREMLARLELKAGAQPSLAAQ